jgi:hypothetical protein
MLACLFLRQSVGTEALQTRGGLIGAETAQHGFYSAPAPHQPSADMRGAGRHPLKKGIICVVRFGQNISLLKFRKAESLESFRANEKNFKKAGDNLNLHSI